VEMEGVEHHPQILVLEDQEDRCILPWAIMVQMEVMLVFRIIQVGLVVQGELVIIVMVWAETVEKEEILVLEVMMVVIMVIMVEMVLL
jgi:hypothetical protein